MTMATMVRSSRVHVGYLSRFGGPGMIFLF